MEITSSADANDINLKLKARDGRDQLLICFSPGLLVWEKNTVMKIAQQFCHEFCIAVGIM
jgi:hypothetical protein